MKNFEFTEYVTLVVTFLYASASISYLLKKEYAWAFVWFSYAMANVGLVILSLTKRRDMNKKRQQKKQQKQKQRMEAYRQKKHKRRLSNLAERKVENETYKMKREIENIQNKESQIINKDKQ